MTARVPVGVVGVGALGRHHARHLASLADAELVGVFDLDHERAANVAQEVGTRAFPDCDSLFSAVRAVSIVVPTVDHHQVGLEALNRGLPVLMEKPLASTLEQADALVAAAEKSGVPLQVGHIERFNRAVRAAEPHLDGPLYLESQRVAPYQPRGTDVAVVLDLMIHDLDLMLHLTGGALATDVRASGVAVLSPTSTWPTPASSSRTAQSPWQRPVGWPGTGCANCASSSLPATCRSTWPRARACSSSSNRAGGLAVPTAWKRS